MIGTEPCKTLYHADMAKLADALALGASYRKVVQVQVLLSAQVCAVKLLGNAGGISEGNQRRAAI